jgi:hypothetical protein
MAHHGIDNFKIKQIEEVIDEQLDDRESFWITELNTKIPNGYNLMSGGGTNGNHSEETKALISKQRCARIDTNRNAKLQGLPPYTAYRNEKGAGEMIRINKHPLCYGKNFYAKKYDNSLEKTKEAVIKFIRELEESGQKYIK